MMDGNPLQRRARRVPVWLRAILFCVTLGATAISFFTYRGPYAWLAELQASLFHDEHYVGISLLGAFFLCIIPVGIVIHVIASFMPKTAEELAREQPYGRP